MDELLGKLVDRIVVVITLAALCLCPAISGEKDPPGWGSDVPRLRGPLEGTRRH